MVSERSRVDGSKFASGMGGFSRSFKHNFVKQLSKGTTWYHSDFRPFHVGLADVRIRARKRHNTPITATLSFTSWQRQIRDVVPDRSRIFKIGSHGPLSNRRFEVHLHMGGCLRSCYGWGNIRVPLQEGVARDIRCRSLQWCRRVGHVACLLAWFWN